MTSENIAGDAQGASQTLNSTFTLEPELNIVVMAMCASLMFSFATELIGWFVVYRHDDYKKQV